MWRRAWASLIDGALIAVGMALLWWIDVARLRWPHGPYDWLDELGTLFGEHLPRLGPPLLALLAVSATVQLGGRLLGRGTSLGERAAGLRLLDRVGDAPGALRQGVRTISGVLTAWPLGWLVCLADEGKQSLADRMSGTRLVLVRV